VEAGFKFKLKVHLGLRCKIKASFFPCGKQDNKLNTFFWVFTMFFKVFIVLLFKLVVLFLVVGVHYVVIGY